MKIKNIFKKNTKSGVKTNLQPLDKKQLEKVIGGSDRKSGSIVLVDREGPEVV